MKTKLLGIAASMVLFAAISPASANIIVNGSFEDGIDPGSSFTTIFGGDNTSITGWTVGGDSVDYINGYWQAGDGARSIDLSGNALGSVSQSFAVTNGQVYSVSFLVAGNTDGGPTIKEVGVTTNGSSQDFFFNTTGLSRGNMGWTPESFTFTAVGSSETLTFASLACDPNANPTCAFGAALDNVSVSAVPELSTWGMMLLGFAGIGAIAYRRARKASPIAVV